MTKQIFLFNLLLCMSFAVHAKTEFFIEIKDHLFTPSTVYVPAGEKVKLTFINLDDTPEELDSFDLNREKVVFANSKASIYIGPLKPGTYGFFGEFNPSSAVGQVIVISKEEYQRVNQ